MKLFSGANAEFLDVADPCTGFSFAVAAATGSALASADISFDTAPGSPASAHTAYNVILTFSTPNIIVQFSQARRNSVASGTTTTTTSSLSIPFVANQFFHFETKCPSANGGKAAGSITIYSPEAGDSRTIAVAANTNTDSTFIRNSQATVATTTGDVFIDNYICECFSQGVSAVPGYVWCSSPGQTDFGFDAKQNVKPTSNDGGEAINGDDPSLATTGYQFQNTFGDEVAYLGKNLDTGTTQSHAYNTTFKIEAGVENTASDFRITYSLVSGFSAGNGQTTGSFANAIQARFVENGNSWHISTRTIIGGVVADFGNSADRAGPNDAHAFQFIVDTRAASPTVKILDDANGVIIQNALPSFASNLPITAQFFSTFDNVIIITTNTALSQPGDVNDGTVSNKSTCVYDIEGTASPLPNPGALPCVPTNTTVCSTTGGSSGSGSQGCSFFCVDSTTVPSGFTVAAFNGLLGLLLVAGIGGGFAFITRSPILIVIGVALGYILGILFGLLPLWPAIVIAVVAVAIVFVKMRGA